jgi:hypothetical protein
MKVVIIGKGSGWEDAPHKGECWGITQLLLRRPVTRVIDMNDYSLWGEQEAREAQQARAKAADNGIPYIDLKTYPLDGIMEFFHTDYFSNTVDYAIALALYEQFTEIDLYGVNMANPGEYSYQKPGVDFWCGMSKGMGVSVRSFGRMSTIMQTQDAKLYGYGYPQTLNRDTA